MKSAKQLIALLAIAVFATSTVGGERDQLRIDFTGPILIREMRSRVERSRTGKPTRATYFKCLDSLPTAVSMFLHPQYPTSSSRPRTSGGAFGRTCIGIRMP